MKLDNGYDIDMRSHAWMLCLLAVRCEVVSVTKRDTAEDIGLYRCRAVVHVVLESFSTYKRAHNSIRQRVAYD